MDWEEFKREFIEAALINNSENVKVYERTCWLPRKCYISGKKLFRKPCLKLVRDVPTVTKGRIKETYWMDKHEYLMFVMKCSR